MKGRLYGIDQACERLLETGQQIVWIVEGESDTWALDAVGLIAVGLPGATTWQSDGEDAVRLAEVLLEVGGQAMWISDADQAGQQALTRLLSEPLGIWQDVPFFCLSELGGYKDVGDAWADLDLLPQEFLDWLLDFPWQEVHQAVQQPASFPGRN